WSCKRDDLLLVCGWAWFAPVFYFLLAINTEAKLFIPRYLLSSAPEMALLTGLVITSLAAGRSRRIVAGALAAGAVLAFGLTRLHGNEDWRGAMEAVRAEVAGTETPVLF